MKVEITREEAQERYPKIPEQILDSLYRYVEKRIPTGGFLRAVLANDLFEAMGRADSECINAILYICQFIYCNCPGGCYGSYQRVNEWIEGED